MTYLSMAPHGLHHVLLTGGLPPIDDGCTAETVYRACYKRVAIQNAKFYKRFPGDAEVVRSVVLHLAQCEGGGVSVLRSSLWFLNVNPGTFLDTIT